MSMNAVALVHIAPAAVKEALEPGPEEERAKLGDPRLDVCIGADDKIYVIEAFDDATAIRLGIPLGYADPEVMGVLVATALGDLIDSHDDPRGVPLIPESYVPKARAWDALIEELGELADWAPIEGPEIVDPAADMFGALGADPQQLMQMAAQMQGQDPSVLMQQAMQMAQQLAASGAMDEIQRAMQQMMQGQGMPPGGGDADGGVPGGMPGMGMDFAAMAAQAQSMLDANPALRDKLMQQMGGAEPPGGDDVVDAELEDAPDSKKE